MRKKEDSPRGISFPQKRYLFIHGIISRGELEWRKTKPAINYQQSAISLGKSIARAKAQRTPSPEKQENIFLYALASSGEKICCYRSAEHCIGRNCQNGAMDYIRIGHIRCIPLNHHQSNEPGCLVTALVQDQKVPACVRLYLAERGSG